MTGDISLSGRGLERYLGEAEERVHALRGVSLDVEAGSAEDPFRRACAGRLQRGTTAGSNDDERHEPCVLHDTTSLMVVIFNGR